MNIDSGTLDRWARQCEKDIADMKKYGKMFCVYCRSGTDPNCYCRPITVDMFAPKNNSK